MEIINPAEHEIVSYIERELTTRYIDLAIELYNERNNIAEEPYKYMFQHSVYKIAKNLTGNSKLPFQGRGVSIFDYYIRTLTLMLEKVLTFDNLTLGEKGRDCATPQLKVVYRNILEKLKILKSTVLSEGYTVPSGKRWNSLGSFPVIDHIYVVDPGEDVRERGVILVTAVKGTWNARVRNNLLCCGEYLTECLLVAHEDAGDLDDATWDVVEADIQVETGQAAFFCSTGYVWDSEKGWEEFYEQACECTLDTDFGSKLHPNGKGVVAHSGHGDGRYTLEVVRCSTGQICAARVEFVT